jgi:glutamate/tyrosine decarboxylase-like PLP-dependent enzyme
VTDALFQLQPVALIGRNRHYSWEKLIDLCGNGLFEVGFVDLDRSACLDTRSLHERIGHFRLKKRPILMVTSTVGATSLGSFDPIDQVNRELKSHEVNGLFTWQHIDAAYGGLFASLRQSPRLSPKMRRILESFKTATSITIDPHKLGYVPYSSGAFLTAKKRDYCVLPEFEMPYIQTSSDDPGPVTIEGSRSAAGAIATHLTSESIGFSYEGYGRILELTLAGRKKFEKALKKVRGVYIAPDGMSNILCFLVAKPGEPLSATNRRTKRIYRAFSPTHNGQFIVSKTSLSFTDFSPYLHRFTQSWRPAIDDKKVHLIRICLMNPFVISKNSNLDFAETFAQELRRRLHL